MNINDFGPFKAEVWGTVSDWFNGFIGFFGLIILIGTLKNQSKATELQAEATASQAKASEEQTKVNLMSQMAFKRSNKPNVVAIQERTSKSGGNVIFKFLDNEALNVKILNRSNEFYQFPEQSSFELRSLAAGSELSAYYFEGNRQLDDPLLQFEIYYTSHIGIRYKQIATASYLLGGGFVVSSPEEIDDYEYPSEQEIY